MADMNKSDIDSIAKRLRRNEPAVADDGFTAEVMARLPRSEALPAWQKNLILLAATALGSAIAAWHFPPAIIPELLNLAAADWPILFGASIALVYGAAIAGIWTADRH